MRARLSPTYARAPRGERARGKAPRNWGRNVSPICAIDSEGVKPSMSVEGAVDGEAFEAYVERFLAPELKRGRIVAMDNPSVHRGKRVERLIEEAFTKVKGVLRKVAARTRGALVEATGRALDAITLQDVRGFYADCGYRLPVQSS